MLNYKKNGLIIKKFKPEGHKIKALVYGSSGVGKTTFAGTVPNAIFASAEGGLLSIAEKRVDYVEIKSLSDLKTLLNYLKNSEHKYTSVVIDSITEINEVIISGIEKQKGRQMQLQDWGTLQKELKGVLRDFRNLPMHVLFIAQETEHMDDQKVHKIVPMLSGKAATGIAYFMDIVGHISVDGNGNRFLMTNAHQRYVTKDRSGMIGDGMDIDFSVWIDLISKIEVGTQDVITEIDESASNHTLNDQQEQNSQVQGDKKKEVEPIQEGMIRVDQRNKFFAIWRQLYNILTIENPEDYPKDKMESLRTRAIQHYFKRKDPNNPGKEIPVRSMNELTETQADNLIERVQMQIDEKKNTSTALSNEEKMDFMVIYKGLFSEIWKEKNKKDPKKFPLENEVNEFEKEMRNQGMIKNFILTEETAEKIAQNLQKILQLEKR